MTLNGTAEEAALGAAHYVFAGFSSLKRICASGGDTAYCSAVRTEYAS